MPQDDPTTEPTTTELIAVIVAVTDREPRILTVDGQSLPAGAFLSGYQSLQASLREWVEKQTRHRLGYIEQLYTFADHGRTGNDRRTISISYLGLTREAEAARGASWQGWYRYFPWEDHRTMPRQAAAMEQALRAWAEAAPNATARAQRHSRAAYTFGWDGHGWNEDLVLHRYELLYEAALVEESPAFRADLTLGTAMRHDHRRILATGIARLRAKIKYRPVVFELMPPEFTLLALQQCVEALAGRRLHKPNFRRLIAQAALVEETGGSQAETGGRPARLYRFRRDVLLERAFGGTKLPVARSR